MSCNKDRKHVFVLPEDDSNKVLALGFHLRVNVTRQMQVLRVAGGWKKVLEKFKSDHVKEMVRYPERFMVLLIDFDGRDDRLEHAKAAIPENLADRVFVLGAWSKPEDLRVKLGAYEQIGSDLAEDCRAGTDKVWGHELLRHNASELGRLREQVRPILF